MRVHLPSRVIRLDVGLRLINKTDDLDVIWGPHELNTSESTVGDKTGAMTRLGTPCDSLVLGFTDGREAVRWGPNTEIWRFT